MGLTDEKLKKAALSCSDDLLIFAELQAKSLSVELPWKEIAISYIPKRKDIEAMAHIVFGTSKHIILSFADVLKKVPSKVFLASKITPSELKDILENFIE